MREVYRLFRLKSENIEALKNRLTRYFFKKPREADKKISVFNEYAFELDELLGRVVELKF